MIAPPPLTEPSGGPWPGHPLFSLESLYRAYRQCRRRKRHTHNALAFERDLEANLLAFREAIAGDGDHPTVDEVTDVVTLHVDVFKTHWFKHALIPNTACRRG
jgi:hypothetical protein